MAKRIIFFSLWVGFIVYAFLLAPPDQPNTLSLILDLSTGKWEEINPLIVSLFNIMGIWPLIYSGVLFADGRSQRLPVWPFAIASFGVGAFALLPYLALRQPNGQFPGSKTWLIWILDSRWLGGAIALGTLALLGYGLGYGNGSDFVEQWQTSRFIHVMSLDFCLLALLFPALLGDDLARRGLDRRHPLWVLGWVPLLGPVAYLCCRPPLIATPDASTQLPKTDASSPVA
ncbi:MAG: DUF2834 domain-containing protein [Synechococcales bacterium]|nr:DUF2834 domain-containing protein [Synechococcales bacterium]